MAMWSVSNLKDRGRLVLYLRLVTLELMICFCSSLLDPDRDCGLATMFGFPVSSDAVSEIEFDSAEAPARHVMSLGVGSIGDDEEEEVEEEITPTALVAVNTNLSVFSLPCYIPVLSWFVWIWESLFNLFA